MNKHIENKILTFAKSLPDHRMERRKLHRAENIVFITLASVIRGAVRWEDIADFSHAKKEFLDSILSRETVSLLPIPLTAFLPG